MITQVEVESVHGAPEGQRMVFYRCTKDDGTTTSYGPVITCDSAWDADAYCEILRVKLNEAAE